DRGLRHDRGRAPDGQQPAAAARAQAGQRGRAGGAADCHPRRRGRDPRPECHAGLREQSRGQRERIRGRVVPHRRPGRDRRGRLPAPDGPTEGADQPRRREVLAAGDRPGAHEPPRCVGGPGLRAAPREAGRGARRRGGAARGPQSDRARAARLRACAPAGLQGAAQDRGRERDPQGSDREAAAHRSCEAARARGMKICVYGAGAIGGLLGAKLALAGHEVTLIARGPHLEAMKARGLKLVSEGKTEIVRPRVTGDSREAGHQDAVILSVKAHALAAIADAVQPLLGENTALVPAINGVPWWYFYKLPGPYENTKLRSVDPGGVLWEKLPPSRVIGCIVYPA